jgi:uncharacterized protein YndB with AHSA1/START domain
MDMGSGQDYRDETILTTYSYMILQAIKRETMDIRPLAILLMLAMCTIAPAQSGMNHAEELANNGQIDEHAAVKASSEILIAAPTEKVWRLLVEIDEWPRWQPNITAAKITGPLNQGTEFEWSTGGTKIKSRLAVVKPGEELAWTGKALHTTAIHVWQFRATPNGGTVVSTRESMSGFMLKLRVLYSSKDLEKSQKAWLDALKREAER